MVVVWPFNVEISDVRWPIHRPTKPSAYLPYQKTSDSRNKNVQNYELNSYKTKINNQNEYIDEMNQLQLVYCWLQLSSSPLSIDTIHLRR